MASKASGAWSQMSVAGSSHMVADSSHGHCDCEKSFRTAQLQFVGVPGHGYLDQLDNKAWTCDIYYDLEHKIGPSPHLISPNRHYQYSPFVLSVGFLGPCGEDETSCIDGIMAYTRLKFSALHVPQAASGILLTRNATSIQIRMACMPICCSMCGRCKNCLSQIPAINTFVERLGTMALNIYIRQRKVFWKAEAGEKPPYPRTEAAAFTKLFTRLLRGFHKGGIHKSDAAVFQQGLPQMSRYQAMLVASTYHSAPVVGCVYSVETRSITDIPPPRSPEDTLRCDICLEDTARVALIQMPCDCFRCIDCLGQSLNLALSARHHFPTTCCGTKIHIQKYADFVHPDLITRYLAIADEFTAVKQLYCDSIRCFTFIRASLVADEIGICPKCFARTCAKCGKLESKHLYQPHRACPKDETEERLDILAGKQQWKGCPQCRALIERSDGCNHMKCHCGQMFCYQCGAAYAREPDCNCGLGLEYLQDQESDEEENRWLGGDDDDDSETDEDINEDEEDTQQRERLLEAGVELRRGDLERIRAEEIRLVDAAQERQVRAQTDGPAPDVRVSLGQNSLDPFFRFAVVNTTEPADGPAVPQRAVASRRAPNSRRVVGAPPVW